MVSCGGLFGSAQLEDAGEMAAVLEEMATAYQNLGDFDRAKDLTKRAQALDAGD